MVLPAKAMNETQAAYKRRMYARGRGAEYEVCYGNRNVPKMYAQINALRSAIRAEGTPAIQKAWDAVEEHIDFAYRPVIKEDKDQ